MTDFESAKPKLTTTPDAATKPALLQGDHPLEGDPLKGDPMDLPMIVWIRGDEDYSEQFDLDADDVMRELGIRRSRLTQISGKELRVGRKRDGRYIKPVYRSRDVEAYRSWTRPSASHVKSSNVVKEAASRLAEQAESLASLYRGQFQEVQDAVEDKLLDQGRALRRFLAAQARALSERHGASLNAFNAKSLFNQRSMLRRLEQLQGTAMETLARLPAWNLLRDELANLRGSLGEVREGMRDLKASQNEILLEVRVKLSTMEEKLDKKFANLEEQLKELRPEPPRKRQKSHRLRQEAAQNPEAKRPRLLRNPRKPRLPF